MCGCFCFQMYCYVYGLKFVGIEMQKENIFFVNYLKSIDSMYVNCEYMYNLKKKIDFSVNKNIL